MSNPFCVLFIGLLIFCLCSRREAHAQARSPMRFEVLTVRHGLSQSTANALLQDRRGFLWIGTADGLNRYDGYKIKAYTHDPQDSLAVCNNYINGLAEDNEGRIWAATRNGLACYNWADDTFTNYYIDLQDLSHNHFITMVLDGEGVIWLSAHTFGLYRFDTRTYLFTHHNFVPQGDAKYLQRSIHALCIDQYSESF